MIKTHEVLWMIKYGLNAESMLNEGYKLRCVVSNGGLIVVVKLYIFLYGRGFVLGLRTAWLPILV